MRKVIMLKNIRTAVSTTALEAMSSIKYRTNSQSRKIGSAIASFARRSSGTASVEFVIVLPVLTLFLFGIMQFGFVLHVQNNMENAAREAARSMSVGETSIANPGSAEAYALNYMTNPNFPFAVTATEPTSEQVQVQITLPATHIVFGDMFGLWSGKNLTATVTMRKEI